MIEVQYDTLIRSLGIEIPKPFRMVHVGYRLMHHVRSTSIHKLGTLPPTRIFPQTKNCNVGFFGTVSHYIYFADGYVGNHGQADFLRQRSCGQSLWVSLRESIAWIKTQTFNGTTENQCTIRTCRRRTTNVLTVSWNHECNDSQQVASDDTILFIKRLEYNKFNLWRLPKWDYALYVMSCQLDQLTNLNQLYAKTIRYIRTPLSLIFPEC
jgi:hypothetical protein